ncbi:hypothetical protein [Streptomyces sp. NPDC059003]|uniref:hypothetical protein n=1 Tax=Streptomyces sp. NPDC059003 TaxID=3346691 RepID=UPI0036AEF759
MPYPPRGRYGLYPDRLRQQQFGAWTTVQDAGEDVDDAVVELKSVVAGLEVGRRSVEPGQGLRP